MFSKLFFLFSLKRKFHSTEETTTSVGESSDRPTKRVRIEEPSSTNEDRSAQNPPAQASCSDNNEEMEEKEVLVEIIAEAETLATGARLREEARNHVEPANDPADEAQDLLEDAEVAAMADTREERRRHTMAELRREQERVRERRRRHPSTPPAQRRQHEPMGAVERPLRAPLPVPPGVPMSFSLPPSFGIPLIPRLSEPSPRPREQGGWVFGSEPVVIEPPAPIFVLPPPAQPRRSTRRPATPPPTAVDESSPETILASLRQLREQFSQTPPPRRPEADDEGLADDDVDSGDEDLPLFTAMMQAGNPPPPNPEHHRDYPVYEEDLDLPEDRPRVTQPDTRVIIVEPRIMPVVDEEDEDEETEEERLARLVREGEAEEGVDLE